MRGIAAQLGLQLIGVEMDGDGVLPEAVEEAILRHAPRALYLNPTLQNPTTLTMPERRREAVCQITRRHGVPIVEDDAYGFIPAHGPPPLAALRPGRVLAHCGSRQMHRRRTTLAYVVAPDARAAWSFNAAMRALCVMASPIAAAVATRWIDDGTADTILRFIRAETSARERIAARLWSQGTYQSDPLSFNLWLPLRNG